jgi:UDP-glucose 4-epimerase
MTEKMLQWSSLKYVALRYFNVAGADPDGKIGQSFPEATHLIKVACQAALGKRDKVGIFGTDFPTKDGSGVRDYIHVTDLAQAHLLALDYLRKENKSQILNCGYSRGYSVKEVLEKVKSQSGISFKIENHPRREGDPAELIAQSKKIREILNFKPQYDDLDFIIKTALHWEKSRPY